MGRGSYLGGSTILGGARGGHHLLPSQRGSSKKAPLATDSWASASREGGPRKTIKPPKVKKSKETKTAQLSPEAIEERRASRKAAYEERQAATKEKLAGIKVVMKRGSRTLSENSLADRLDKADPSP